jgi:hypothetical protein
MIMGAAAMDSAAKTTGQSVVRRLCPVHYEKGAELIETDRTLCTSGATRSW